MAYIPVLLSLYDGYVRVENLKVHCHFYMSQALSTQLNSQTGFREDIYDWQIKDKLAMV